MSETLMYPGESDVILIRSIFVDYIVANGLTGNGVSPLSRLVITVFYISYSIKYFKSSTWNLCHNAIPKFRTLSGNVL